MFDFFELVLGVWWFSASGLWNKEKDVTETFLRELVNAYERRLTDRDS